jgi:hypothetical protein
MNDLNKKIALVLEIQELSIRITNSSDVDVFCSYSGHTNGLSISVMLEGWKSEDPTTDYSKIIYLDRASVKTLQEIIEYLRIIEKEVNYEINSI